MFKFVEFHLKPKLNLFWSYESLSCQLLIFLGMCNFFSNHAYF